jgi:amino acid adenylation domain-containing protein
MQNNIIDIQTEKIQGFRLSPQQKRLWLLQEQAKNNPYQVKGCVVIQGLLNIEKLQQACQKVIDRYEIFKTSFQCLAGMTLPLQVIRDSSNFIWQKIDLSELEIQQQNDYINKFFQATDSNISLSLVTVSEQKYILLINLPALYGDSRSLKILVTQITHYYHNLNSDTVIDNEPMQYADFAEWQNELLEDKETEKGRHYWQQNNFYRLLNLRLSLEKITTDCQQFHPQAIKHSIKSDRSSGIINLTQKNNLSISSFLFTCWQILIYRLTKQTDLVIGMSYDGRKYEELEFTIGAIAKYLPIANQLEDDISSRELWQKNYTLQQEAEQWQEYFSWGDDLAFFPVTFEFERNYPLENTNSISWEISRTYTCCDRFKIKLACQQKDDDLNLSFYYDANLFERNDIQRLAEQFNTVVSSFLNNPEQKIANLEILSESEKQQILIDFNQTNTDFDSFQTIQQTFEQQVIKTPNAIAIIQEDRQLTYQQLNQCANQLAHYLQRSQKGELIGICIDRSLEMIIGILGILKAGFAYIPFDSTYPQQRLDFILEEADVSLVLSEEKLLPLLSKYQNRVICLDSQWQNIQQESDRNLDSINKPDNLAYIIYTSGSTGKPKGVAIEQRQILNYLHSIKEKLNLTHAANFALVSTLAADLGNTMLFPALCTGGCLHPISYECATDGEALGNYFQQHQIDYLKITPSHLTALLSSSQPELVLPRKTVILGGEALNWSLVSKIQALAPNCSIINHYGPTETTVGVLTYEVKEQLQEYLTQTVPIGKPLANTQIYILDEQLQPVPIGVAGELYIGGVQVSRGYLNNPQLTAEKFISIPPSPLIKGGLRGDRLYKTGDLAKYLPDGNIEFLGRIDRQVKIRGFRVELGEIEATLAQHSAIQQAVAIFQEDNQRLIAYTTTKTNLSPPNSRELSDFLTAKLPEYMIPSTFIHLKQFPLTANGKVDRDRLPTPEKQLTTAYTIPQTATEKAIAEIWLEILSVQQVGIHDDFFELGGHSLLATQVVSRIRQTLQTELSLRQFFDSPTVAGLAIIIAQNLAAQTDEETLAQMLAELEEM